MLPMASLAATARACSPASAPTSSRSNGRRRQHAAARRSVPARHSARRDVGAAPASRRGQAQRHAGHHVGHRRGAALRLLDTADVFVTGAAATQPCAAPRRAREAAAGADRHDRSRRSGRAGRARSGAPPTSSRTRRAGTCAMTGDPDREPVKPYGQQAAYQAGLHAALGIVAALMARGGGGTRAARRCVGRRGVELPDGRGARPRARLRPRIDTQRHAAGRTAAGVPVPVGDPAVRRRPRLRPPAQSLPRSARRGLCRSRGSPRRTCWRSRSATPMRRMRCSTAGWLRATSGARSRRRRRLRLPFTEVLDPGEVIEDRLGQLTARGVLRRGRAPAVAGSAAARARRCGCRRRRGARAARRCWANTTPRSTPANWASRAAVSHGSLRRA